MSCLLYANLEYNFQDYDRKWCWEIIFFVNLLYTTNKDKDGHFVYPWVSRIKHEDALQVWLTHKRSDSFACSERQIPCMSSQLFLLLFCSSAVVSCWRSDLGQYTSLIGRNTLIGSTIIQVVHQKQVISALLRRQYCQEVASASQGIWQLPLITVSIIRVTSFPLVILFIKSSITCLSSIFSPKKWPKHMTTCSSCFWSETRVLARLVSCLDSRRMLSIHPSSQRSVSHSFICSKQDSDHCLMKQTYLNRHWLQDPNDRIGREED